MSRKITGFLSLAAVFAFLLFPVGSFAQTNGGTTNPPAPAPVLDPNEARGNIFGITYECAHGRAGECTFADLIAATMHVVKWGTGFALLFTVIVIAYAGFNFMISGDNPKKRSDAKNALQKAVIGIVFIIAAWLIVQLIVSALNVNTGPINFR